MDVINIMFDYSNVTININTLFILFIIIVIFLKNYSQFIKYNKHIEIEEASLGIGNNIIKFKPNYKDKEIAYKLWIELSTRKIGIPINLENDVITELYDSWYTFFKISRETLKEFPPAKLNKKENDIIRINLDVLNKGLRNHLTKWQARYRYWYNQKIKNEKNLNKTPQEIQKEYPQYKELTKDLLKTNEELIRYKKILYQIIYNA